MFSIAMYFFGLVWTETCNFGSAILVGSGLIVFAYFTLVIYDPKSTPFDLPSTLFKQKFSYFVWALKNNSMIEGMNRTESESSSNISKTSKIDIPYETEEDEISEL